MSTRWVDGEFVARAGISLSEARANRAKQWVEDEISKLLHVIDLIGEDVMNGMSHSAMTTSTTSTAASDHERNCHVKVVTFGYLFQVYQNVSDTLVGILVRARKRKVISYEGMMLFQGKHDHVHIYLTKQGSQALEEVDRDALGMEMNGGRLVVRKPEKPTLVRAFSAQPTQIEYSKPMGNGRTKQRPSLQRLVSAPLPDRVKSGSISLHSNGKHKTTTIKKKMETMSTTKSRDRVVMVTKNALIKNTTIDQLPAQETKIKRTKHTVKKIQFVRKDVQPQGENSFTQETPKKETAEKILSSSSSSSSSGGILLGDSFEDKIDLHRNSTISDELDEQDIHDEEGLSTVEKLVRNHRSVSEVSYASVASTVSSVLSESSESSVLSSSSSSSSTLSSSELSSSSSRLSLLQKEIIR